MKDKLAIIVPYRDREEHLNVFVPHMHEFLKDKGIDYTIFIAEQTDDRPFNYGKLCNVVTKEIGNEYTYFAFHDIDMLPISDECDYSYPDSPTHLATNVEAHDNKLPYPQYFGGVVLINREDFEKANGYSNEYWGYGFEDLDLLYRLERSGAYLEKYYDLNQTYERYDSNDILPYRIENVKPILDKKTHSISTTNFGLTDRVYSSINKLTLNTINNNFFLSFWFNDSDSLSEIKNLISFEGCDSGVFISKSKQVIGQVWDELENHYEIAFEYHQNRWNHVVYGIKDNNFILYLNNIKIEKSLEENFKIYNYEKHCIKISEFESTIKLSNIKIFEGNVNDEIVSSLYFDGELNQSSLINKFGISLANEFNFNSFYKNKFILDNGKNLNHLKFDGILKSDKTQLLITSNLFLPVRLQGEYKSLVHDDDTNIIKKYYKYDPDIEENSDIFFHDVIPNKLDYKTIGLSSLKYTLLDIQNKKNYELIRIVT